MNIEEYYKKLKKNSYADAAWYFATRYGIAVAIAVYLLGGLWCGDLHTK